jgi:hypothetical protein
VQRALSGEPDGTASLDPAKDSISLAPCQIQPYIDMSVDEPKVLRRLREETAGLPSANMQIASDQGAFMAFLIELIGARRCIEVGTFTGYSALAVALALPENGELITCDVSEEWTAVARRYWAEAGLDGKIDLHLAPALETLDALLEGVELEPVERLVIPRVQQPSVVDDVESAAAQRLAAGRPDRDVAYQAPDRERS